MAPLLIAHRLIVPLLIAHRSIVERPSAHGTSSRRFARLRPSSVCLLSFVGLTSACVPEFDDDLSLISETRIVAVKATPAEAEPGDTVELTALVVDDSGTVTDAPLEWALCIARKPLTELGPLDQRCIDEFGKDDDELFLPLGAGQTTTAVLPDEVCSLFGPLAPPREGDEEGGRPVDPDLSGGYYQPVVVGDAEATVGSIRISCGATGLTNEEVIAYNRGYRPNENPSVLAITAVVDGERQSVEEGETLSVAPDSEVSFELGFPDCPTEAVCGDGLCTAGENSTDCREDCLDAPRGCEGAEQYLYADTETRESVERAETLEVVWLTTSGTFPVAQTEAETDKGQSTTNNTWDAPGEAGVAHLWFVVRDDRGGVGFRGVDVEVAP